MIDRLACLALVVAPLGCGDDDAGPSATTAASGPASTGDPTSGPATTDDPPGATSTTAADSGDSESTVDSGSGPADSTTAESIDSTGSSTGTPTGTESSSGDTGAAVCEEECSPEVGDPFGACDAPQVTWTCTGRHDRGSFAACEVLPTALVRYCCPASVMQQCP